MGEPGVPGGIGAGGTLDISIEAKRAVRQTSGSAPLYVLVAVLPVLVLLGAVVFLLNSQYRAAAEHELEGLARAYMGAVDAELMSAVRLAEVLAAEDEIAQGDFPDFDRESRRILKTQPNFRSILLLDLAAETYLSHTDLAPGETGPAGELALRQSREVAQNRKAQVFGVRRTGPTVTDPIVPVRAPVVGAGLENLVVSVGLSTAGLNGTFSHIAIDSAWTGIVLDRDFQIAGHSGGSPEMIGLRMPSFVEAALRSDPSGLVGSPDNAVPARYYAFYRSPATGWSAIVAVPAAYVDGPIQDAMAALIAASILAACAGLGVAVVFGARLRRIREAERRFGETLEELVIQRTAALRKSEEKLMQAQKMEAVGQLTGGLAHDFNNHLGVIVGNLDLAASAIGPAPEARPFVQAALDGALRGGELIKQLMSFSRRQILNPVVFDVNQRLRKSETLIDRAVGETVALKLRLADDPWRVRADPAQFESSILNLAINARDAMPKGGTLEISTANVHLDSDYVESRPDAAVGDYLCVSVSDTGSGMPPEIVDRVFEPFFTTKEQGKGTGLGLSMVYGFVKQSGGHIAIYSEVEFGTTIDLYLPRAPEEERQGTAAAAPEAPLPKGAETVLLVEDNPGMRAIAERQLTSLGYRVRTAANGAEALALLDSGERVDLLFSDIVMPGGMTGLELADEASSRWPDIKVLMTTGFHGETMRGGAVKWRILTKPYRIADLARAVREELDGKAGPAR